MNTRCDTGKDALPRTAIFRPRQKSRATSLYRFALLVGAFIAAATPAAQFKFPNQTLTVPDGFEVERVAATPQVARPIYGAFDDQGHFYVVDSSGSNEKPDKQLQEKPHRIVRLEDTKGEGRFDKSIVFADKMMFPEGCMWYEGSVYVAAPPSIWKLTDTDGDGVADKREEWFQGKTLTGCANDLHGPYLGLDGWIYWCKGAFATQTYERPGRKPFVTRAAHIFRARPDGSGIEPVLTGGMDNPVSVAFTAEGERFLCGTFFMTHEPGRRDGIIHAIYGGVYGKINDVTDAHKKTGDLMPIMTHMGPAAPCSVIRYESQVFGKEYQDNLFLCAFNLHKVTRHVLEPDGATFKTQDSDFVTSDNPDFHPTDVIEDADGSLVLIDTGGWYKLCCPTSQLPKPDVLGAIYRIRRVGVPKVADARGAKIPWENASAAGLANLLDDDRPAVCKRAMQQLAKKGASSVSAVTEVLKKSTSTRACRNAVWTLTRIDSPAAREGVRWALREGNGSVRQAAMHSISLWADVDASQELLNVLQVPSAQAQRLAAEALGRIGSRLSSGINYENGGKVAEENSLNWIVPGLLTAGADEHDRVLEHSITYALIETDLPLGTAEGLNSSSVYEQRTALIAMDQMEHGQVHASQVVPLLDSPEPVLRQTAWWVANHHPDWGGALAGFFKERLAATNLTEDGCGELRTQLAHFAGGPEIQNLLPASLEAPETKPAVRILLLQAMADADPKQPSPHWVGAVRSCLLSKEAALLPAAVAAAKSLSQVKTNAPDFSEPLLGIARNESYPAGLRLEALAALRNGLRPDDSAIVNFVRAQIDPTKPVQVRGAAASVLANAKLNEEQLLELVETAKIAGPLELTKLLGAFEHSSNESVGLKLLAALKESKGLASLRPDVIKTLFAKYPPAVQEKANGLITMVNADAEKQSAHLEDLLGALKDGDVRRGQTIFNSPKAACFSCHKLGYLGGTAGPDLTSIGQVRTERDLLESIIYPNASFVRSYEPVIVMTKSDEQYNGVVRKDAANELVLATGPNTEARIARADIADIKPGTVSIMPAGLDQQLSKQELADLLAFLKATKWGPR